jgi:hypothetical protein
MALARFRECGCHFLVLGCRLLPQGVRLIALARQLIPLAGQSGDAVAKIPRGLLVTFSHFIALAGCLGGHRVWRGVFFTLGTGRGAELERRIFLRRMVGERL